MDANGQRFWLLAGERHFRFRDHVVWDGPCRALRLASERRLPPAPESAAAFALANTALERVPRALDPLGTLAYWNGAANAVVARSTLPDEAVTLPLAGAPTDLLVGCDGVLYCALNDAIRMHDLRGRWADQTVAATGFAPWRLAAHPDGGVWVLERASGRLARLSGSPLPAGPFVDYAGTVFRPCPENCHPPRFEILDDPGWPTGERPVALASHAEGGLALLSWLGDGNARLRLYETGTRRLAPAWSLVDARYAYALTWIDAQKVAIRLPGRRDAPVFDWAPAGGGGSVFPSGDIYPLAAEAEEAPFVHRQEGPPHYPVALTPGTRGAEALHRLSRPSLARRGEARNYRDDGAHLIDSGSHTTVWHRLYAEAQLPPRTGFVVWLAASAEAQAPAADDVAAWQPHCFGESPDLPASPQAPRATWENGASELPHHPGLAHWEYATGRAGLLSVLIQNAGARVRALAGRYLWVRVELLGDGRAGPQIAALRVYANRFSYRDRYLPRLYRESVFGTPAQLPGERVAGLALAAAADLDAGGDPPAGLRERLESAGITIGAVASLSVERAGQAWLLRDLADARAWRLLREQDGIGVYRPQATPADFLERMLANFEGVLTPLEDRIASAHLLSHPLGVPQENLDWLASWIGVAFEPALPAERRRDWLAAAPQLARTHGTLQGLKLALDIASGGGVTGGEIVVVEDFRLRRLLATLLGVNLNEENDPLLPGLIVSGNSVVGDTLTLSERAGVELLALFRAELASAEENAGVIEFLDRLAHRATVLVHQSVSPQDLGLLRRVVELESPAHVITRVEPATWPFLVGVASLIGVDTYLGPARTHRPARTDRSSLGQDYVIGPVSLDPRMAGAAAPPPAAPPVADAGEDFVTAHGSSFELHGEGSSAAPGRELRNFIWRRLPPD
ncbi:phage tail protein [Methylococcus sp. EFPC2]|uniref:phage tail protein n=1 Tax=Methylococcus sp. EFPC2 TaxID=2812648 RepID=UPI001967369F|nr:phage tail protein [Methylococcus sp. EFPC2]QSA98401.1 hypothetical protein JWZ97_06225 [Methylococcus sp. EFPC2]